MKTRKGFVSNSSSSSFVIGKYLMTEEQVKEFSEWIKKMNNTPHLQEKDIICDCEDECTCDEKSGFWESYVHESDNYFTGNIENCDSDKIQVKLESMGIDEKKYDFSC